MRDHTAHGDRVRKGGVRRHGGVQCISIVHAAARPLPRRPDQQPDMEMSVLTERNTIGPPSYGDERVDRAQRIGHA